MENKVRVFVKEHGSYGVVSLEELKDNKLANVSVHFYRNKSKKDETPVYELAIVRKINKSNLK